MAVDNRQQVVGLSYDQMRYPQAPHFTNPWVSGATSGQLYPTSLPQTSMVSDPGAHHLIGRAPSVSMPYHAASIQAPSLPSGINQLGDLYAQCSLPEQDGLHASRPYGASYTTSGPSPGTLYAPTSAPQYSADFAHSRSPYAAYQQDRRSSHPSVASTMFLDNPVQMTKYRKSSLVDNSRLHNTSEAERNSFSDALDASRGMVAMSQDITPRNIYGNQASSRSSSDSYGFPSTHSAHSSISSASTYPSSYYGSVSESSYGDYSSAGESVDLPSRTLPRPSGLPGASLPPAPQSMMGQFSSKVSSSSQKKHKCKICDKRFTRPSSLQTHMYSHTGEKRKTTRTPQPFSNKTDCFLAFACDVEGCGRHFSVVSNLRRHRKVHKGGDADSHASPDDE